MDFILKRMNIRNFKGIRERTVDFDETLTKISGKNASGKTTIMDAFFWALTNTDSELHSNPPIFPLGVAECTPEVEIIFIVDGRENRLKKTQTRKVTSGDTRKVAMTNNYYYNDVPMAERDVNKKFTDLGVDLDKFQELSHTSAFLSLKKEDQRKTLFEMAGNLTDLDIAVRMGDVPEVVEQLEKYSATEIKAMQKATLKRINEVYGVKGEILQAKIEGLELSKIEHEFSALELLKNDLYEKLSVIDTNRKSNIETEKSLGILREKALNLQMEISGMKNTMSATKTETLNKLKRECDEGRADLDRAAKRWKELQADKATTETKLANETRNIDKLNDNLSAIQAMAFDEKSEICPTCGQRLPDENIQTLRQNFENEKARKIRKAIDEIEATKSVIEGYEGKLKALEPEIEKTKNDGKTIQDAYTEVKNKYEAYKLIPADEPTEDLKIKEQELADVNAKIEEVKKAYIPNLDLQEVDIREQLKDTELKLGQAHTNALIDEKIADLRVKQAEYEQNRADAEKILYQLDKVEREKNLLLTDEINKHFDLVKWSFFKQQKNGDWVTTCECYVGDKELGAALNTAMQIRAKIDICNSLQKFYDQHFPLWNDNSEALDSENQGKLLVSTQLVLLEVKD